MVGALSKLLTRLLSLVALLLTCSSAAAANPAATVGTAIDATTVSPPTPSVRCTSPRLDALPRLPAASTAPTYHERPLRRWARGQNEGEASAPSATTVIVRQNGRAREGVQPTQAVSNAIEDVLSASGSCHGPACGLARPGQAVTNLNPDIGDTVALAGGLITGQGPAEGGAADGVPGGMGTGQGSLAAQLGMGAANVGSTLGGARGALPGAKYAAQGFAKGQLDRHFAKHAAEWGAGNITKTGYLNRAQQLLGQDVGRDILGHVRANGDVLRYNVRTNEFAAGTADGTIRTLFRPSDGMSYWLQQVTP